MWNMRFTQKKIIILISVMLISFNVFGDSEIRMIGKDYSITDVIVRPVSVGISSWTDDKYGTVPAGFASMCCFSLDNKIRLELGIAFTIQDKLDIAPLTGLSTPIDNFIVGVWYAPFWNLYSPKSSDDPWGVMVGYRF